MKGRSQSSEINSDSPQVMFTHAEKNMKQHKTMRLGCFDQNIGLGSNKPLVQNGVERTHLHYSRENGKWSGGCNVCDWDYWWFGRQIYTHLSSADASETFEDESFFFQRNGSNKIWICKWDLVL